MPSMIADKSFHYRGRAIKAGDTFDAATEKEAKLLNAIRRASYREAKAKPKPRAVSETKAETPTAGGGAAENLNAMLKADLVTLAASYGVTLVGNESKADIIHKIEVKRRYVRRDMQATQ